MTPSLLARATTEAPLILRACVYLAVMATAALTIGTYSSRPAAGATPVEQYNLCSVACGAARRNHSRDVAVFINNSEHALTLSLNEACVADVADIAARTNHSWRIVYSQALQTGCPGSPQSFGNAVIYAGTDQGWGGIYLSNPGLNCSNQTTECRTALCQQIGTLLGTFVPCSSHLAGTSVPSQPNEYATFVAGYLVNHVAWPAGDFNLNSSQVQSLSPVWFNDFVSLLFGNTYSSSNPYTMIDWIWYPKPAPAITYYAPTCDAQGSDHCFARAAIN